MGAISDYWVSKGYSASGPSGGKKKTGLMWATNQGAATPTRAEFVSGSSLPSVKAPVILNKGGAGSGLSGAASSVVSGAKNIVNNAIDGVKKTLPWDPSQSATAQTLPWDPSQGITKQTLAQDPSTVTSQGATPAAVTGQYLDSNGQTDYSKLIRQGMASGASADAVQAWLDSRMAKIAGAGGALDQYAYDPLSQAAQAYISYKRQPQYDSYEDFYDQGGYADAAARRQSILDAQIRQLENYYAGQRSDINSGAEEQARQAYIAYMQGRNSMPQALAASGYTGGMADSQQLALELGYQNNQREIAQARAAALNDLTTALNDARLSASLEGMQAQDDIMREAVNAYQNWLNQQNAAARQNWLTFTDYDMQGQQAAQQNDRSLSNQLALLEAQNRYNTEAAARENEEAKALAGAQLLAGIGDNEALGQYYGWTPEKVAAMDAYFQSQADQAAAKVAADEQSALWDMAIDALKEGDPSLYVQLTGNTGFGEYINDLNDATLAAKLRTGSGSGGGGSRTGSKYLSDPYGWLANQGITDETLAYNALMRQGYTSTAAKEVAQGYVDRADGGLDLTPAGTDAGTSKQNMGAYRTELCNLLSRGDVETAKARMNAWLPTLSVSQATELEALINSLMR